MKMFFRSIQKWMKERKVRRELKKDQALRERCVDYATKFKSGSFHYINALYMYIKEGKY